VTDIPEVQDDTKLDEFIRLGTQLTAKKKQVTIMHFKDNEHQQL